MNVAAAPAIRPARSADLAEICPAWPGQPMSAHWGVEDPAAVEGTEDAKRQAFRQAFHVLEARIRLLVSLPVAKLETIRLKAELDEIGRASPPLP
jgi:arsenate reductase